MHHENSMRRHTRASQLILILVNLLFGAGCGTWGIGPPHLALPRGSAERGQAAFRELRRHACHSVSGHDFPRPTVMPPILVVLGTEDHPPSREDLINSIISPSHRLYPGIDPSLVQTNNVSRMPDFSDVLTVRQLCDLVAFLRTLHR